MEKSKAPIKEAMELKSGIDDKRGWSQRAIWPSFAIFLSFVIGGLLAGATVKPLTWPRLDEPALSQERAGVAGGEIYGSIAIGQSFICPRNGLYRLDILLATYNRRDDKDVIFHLRHAPEGDDLITIQFNASEVEDNAFFLFAFPPIPDSRDQEFYFFLESPHSEPGNAITVRGVTGNVYPEGRAYRNHRATGGEVAFRVYGSKRTLLEWFLEFWAQNPLQIIMFSLYSALVFSVIGFLRHHQRLGIE